MLQDGNTGVLHGGHQWSPRHPCGAPLWAPPTAACPTADVESGEGTGAVGAGTTPLTGLQLQRETARGLKVIHAIPSNPQSESN